MSLQARLTLVLSVILAVAFALLTLAHYRALRQAVLTEIDETLVLRAQSLPHEIPLGPTGYDPEVFYQVVDARDQVLRSSPGMEKTRLPSTPISQPFSSQVQGLPVRVLVVPHGNGFLKVGESMHVANEGVSRSVGSLLLTSLACLALVLASTWAVLNQGLQPLRRVNQVARDILDTNDFSRRLLVRNRPSDVVNQMAALLNRLLARVDTLLESQRRLLADTSHELRNPLMVLRTDVDLLARELPAEMRAEVATEILREVDRMTRLVEDLLALNWVDQKLSLRSEPVRLDVLVQELVERIARSHPERAIDFNGQRVTLMGDRERLLQAAANLVENALHYSDGTVHVRVREAEGEGVLEVRDEGPGIAPEHHQAVFDRFVRLDEKRRGSGLGLSIVKAMVQAHGGRVELESDTGKGALFRFRVPLSA